MKHLPIRTTPFLLFVALLFACGNQGDSAMMEFSPVTVERTVGIDDSQDAPQCRVRLDILQAKNATSEAGRLINEAIVRKIFDLEELSIQAAADSFANTYTRDYRQNMAPLYREDRSDEAKHAWYEYHYNVSTEVRSEAKDVTSYLITIDYYEGGAHGITQMLTMNFDSKTGRQIQLTDIFGADYEATVNDRLLEALYDKTGERTQEALHQRGYLYSMDMFIPENYIIGDDKVTFIFNPYEIAPYSEGRIELEVER